MSSGVQVASRKSKRFTPEFKAEAVRIMQAAGKPVAEVAKDIGVSEQSLYRWARQLGICG